MFCIPQEGLLTTEAALLLPHEHSQDICGVPAHPAILLSHSSCAFGFVVFLIVKDLDFFLLLYLALLVEPLTWKKAHLSNACGTL